MDLEIILLSDKRYLKYVKIFLHSVKDNLFGCKINLCLINVLDNKIESKLKKIYPSITIDHISKKFLSFADKKAFCSNFRVFYISKKLKETKSSLLYMDCDSLVRKGLSFKDFENSGDISILHRDSLDKRFKFATGIIFTRNNSSTKKFFRDWEAAILPKIHTWFSDQITFFENYMKYKNIIVFSQLDKKFIDWEFKDNSIVWTGKGSRKKNNLKYVLETFVYRTNSQFIKNFISFLQQKIS